MPYWLTNPDHGVMPVYSESEVTRHIPLGWSLLNQGESPAVPVMNGDTTREPEDVIVEREVIELPVTSEQSLKGALAESMRLDPPPVVDTSRDSMIPAVSLHEARDEMAPLKRKYVRKAK
jgi:hypothetical protein